MDGETNTSSPRFSSDRVEESTARIFFCDFDNAVKREEDSRNEDIRKLVAARKLKANDVQTYKEDHPVELDKVYAELMTDRESYPDLLKLLKYALLITPSTANVERGFSILTLLLTKQRNRLLPQNLDRLMRLNLLGYDFDDKTWELLVDRFRDGKERRVDL